MGEVRVLQNLWAVNGICKHIRKDTRSSVGLCVNSWWPRDNTCARHHIGLYWTYGTCTRHQVILQG
ncbi:unnamed protein product [Staurois parvus]|uniref:Uncharacterized protein n=1 Tax=Staurois parvus TaxID=386267 RepID=A0ABN9ARS7_9NEOB|nr:unnamed protein product [Staurois parvus]